MLLLYNPLGSGFCRTGKDVMGDSTVHCQDFKAQLPPAIYLKVRCCAEGNAVSEVMLEVLYYDSLRSQCGAIPTTKQVYSEALGSILSKP